MGIQVVEKALGKTLLMGKMRPNYGKEKPSVTPFCGMDEALIWQEIGEKGFRELVAAFYRQILEDDLLGPMYPKHDMDGAEERLYLFLCFRFGGDLRYAEQRGHPRLRMRHMAFRIGEAERDRWVELMRAAMSECDISVEVRSELEAFFTQVADFMRNQGSS